MSNSIFYINCIGIVSQSHSQNIMPNFWDFKIVYPIITIFNNLNIFNRTIQHSQRVTDVVFIEITASIMNGGTINIWIAQYVD